jgi:hypothetical protein
VVDKTEVIS